jgi:hypothetical protein
VVGFAFAFEVGVRVVFAVGHRPLASFLSRLLVLADPLAE